jgi:hypothetical protein
MMEATAPTDMVFTDEAPSEMESSWAALNMETAMELATPTYLATAMDQPMAVGRAIGTESLPVTMGVLSSANA